MTNKIFIQNLRRKETEIHHCAHTFVLVANTIKNSRENVSAENFSISLLFVHDLMQQILLRNVDKGFSFSTEL